ncbi:enhancer of mRNA-decapping protein 4 [Plakobranchus ocellatus]|uniref:Enhancer of mRNA-decapping protein 4 n=1 Tax=Plakobranchus ocellatus TaxID=259542 RepID=A0AAV4C2M2_9GAST|nr:enhancer of mRNA-decapping protein 4 [Plakobranchus ocellatus]
MALSLVLNKTRSSLVIQVDREKSKIESQLRNLTRVIWCPYIPEDVTENNDIDPAKMLVLLHGTRAEVWNVDMVSAKEGSQPLRSDSVSSGIMVIESYKPSMPVVNAAFAPDGSAIAVAYLSGIVKFFLVGFDNSEAECMYDWNPHNGNPLTSLFFLDDHKHQVSDLQLWKFALTGAKHNTEIKLWSCESWACVQMLNFLSPIKQPDLKLQFKSEIDLSSKYLALSDINSKVLYVLQIHQNYSSSTAHVSSVSQFTLTQPCLSFAIYDAGVKRFQHSANDSHLDEITTGELENQHDDENEKTDVGSDSNVTSGVQLKMYGVHVKSLQELLIRYRPETSVPDPTCASSLSQEDTGALRDLLSDVSIDQSEASQDLIVLADTSASQAKPVSVPSPGAKLAGVPDDQSHVSLSSTSSFTEVTAMNEDLLVLDSPRSSVQPTSVLSPPSVFDKTPSQLDSSPGVFNSELNLSSIPLPPITPKQGMMPETSDADNQKTPPPSPAVGPEDTTLVASPEDKQAGHLASQPVIDQSESFSSSAKSGQHLLKEMFEAAQSVRTSVGEGGLGDSLETASSTGSFPIGSLMKSLKPSDEKYDENDQEVAEALGLEQDEEDTKEATGEEEEPEEANDEEDDVIDEDRSKVVWPEPPDVSEEAKRLVDEALVQGTEEEDGEKDFDDDENDDGEVEEIIQHSLDSTDDVNNEGDDELDYGERPHRPEPGQTHHTKALQSIDEKVSNLFEQLRQQQEMMHKMQEELAHQRELQTQLRRHQVEQQQLQEAVEAQQSSTSTLEQDVSRLEDVLASRMERSLAQHMQRENILFFFHGSKFEDALHRTDVQRKQRDDSLQKAVINEVAHSVKHTLADTLRTEIKQTVNPALHRFVEPLKDKIHQEVAHRLTACDTLLKDNISKAVKSRSTMDMLATSIGDVMYQHMQQAYTDAFRTAMLPAYKEALEKSVRDVHGIFQQGTKEYQLYMRQTVDQMLKERIATDELVSRMETTEKQFVQSVAQMKALIISSVREELGGQVAQAVSRYVREELEGQVAQAVGRYVRKELGGLVAQAVGRGELGGDLAQAVSRYVREELGGQVAQAVSRYVSEELGGDLAQAVSRYVREELGGQVAQAVSRYVREELGGQVAQALSSAKGEIVSDVKKLLREEMGQALQEHGANISDQLSTYLRSGAGTPVPYASEEESSKERIMRELRSGRINEAFQFALSVGNIEIVVFACESAKPLDIFAQTPFPLTQPVLLSLISQLSANLDKDFDLKIKYLEDAVTFLDPSQPTSSEHIPNVVGGLVSSLQSCDAHGGDPKKIKMIRMLIMAGKSLLS